MGDTVPTTVEIVAVIQKIIMIQMRVIEDVLKIGHGKILCTVLASEALLSVKNTYLCVAHRYQVCNVHY